MAVFVLVAGAWLGGWVWREVARGLRERGHDVHPLTLTGLGERVHLAHPGVDLETHIADVVNHLDFEDLEQVVLVGHSYAGSVVTGVADRRPERLALLAYCDSAPLADGQSMLDFNSPEGQARLRQQVEQQGDGWRVPPMAWDPAEPGASLRGLTEAHLALLRNKATPQPFGTYTQPLKLVRPGASTYRRAIILCDDGKRIIATARASLAAGESYFKSLEGDDWEFIEMDTGHWPMLSAPEDLVADLDNLARGPRADSGHGGGA